MIIERLTQEIEQREAAGIEAKRADAWRQMRRWLEPRGGRRWV